MSLKDQIINAADCHREAVEVPEWGCTVYVRSVTAADIDAWEDQTYRYNGEKTEINRQNLRARLLIRCLVDEKGVRVFNDHEANELGAKNNTIIKRLYEVAQKVNAVSNKDVEDLAKNS